jgi:hypothetical protein
VSSSARPLTRPASKSGDTLSSSTGVVCTFPALNLNLGGNSALAPAQCKIKNAPCLMLNKSELAFRSARSALEPLIFLAVPLNERKLGTDVPARRHGFTFSVTTGHLPLATDCCVILSHTLHTRSCVSHTAPAHDSAQINSFTSNQFRKSAQNPHTFFEKINTHTIPFPRTFSSFGTYLPPDRVSPMIEKSGKRDSSERSAS